MPTREIVGQVFNLSKNRVSERLGYLPTMKIIGQVANLSYKTYQ